MNSKLAFVLSALFVLSSFVSPAFAEASPLGCEEQTIKTGSAPICNVGADPVDPTHKWVPPADWTLIKTSHPQLITQTTGSGESTCVLPAGNIAANSPDGKLQLIVLCKNRVVKGWLTGTTMPRNPETIREAGERIAAGMAPEDKASAIATASVVINNGGGDHTLRNVLIGMGAAAVIGGIVYAVTQDDDTPKKKIGPDGDTIPIKPVCVPIGNGSNCKSSSSSSNQMFAPVIGVPSPGVRAKITKDGFRVSINLGLPFGRSK